MDNETVMDKKLEKKEMKRNGDNSNRDHLNTIFWGCIILWSGLVFLAKILGLLANLEAPGAGSPGLGIGRLDASWSLIFIGSGVVFLIAAVVRLLVPAYRRPGDGNLFVGAAFIGIGVGDLFNWIYIWPLILILLGALFLVRGFLGCLNR